MKNSKIFFWAVVDALGVFAYVTAVAFLMFNMQKIFGDRPDKFTAPLMFLLLFIISAAITGSLFLGRPIYLYMEGFKKEGIKLLLYTLAFLIIILLGVFAVSLMV